ncbi:MAG: ATP-dependent acyl-CoA ligase [Candidatus Abyssobacteria bacterium SURF_17]|jgi:crotonobetaine/carnitine-CoA ligase|uniref:ATP-dependent acyl-CoA ligase n=1 Tax=Candidatus Abyssobacteria bacterium SURF_17 TaxID=2093361 RepID=A0A419EZY3_9BACT|nr:MAG: ATP-dependent acyl-CoA ligase [Candidatus Abyssubacteria bacterium SURF_17]
MSQEAELNYFADLIEHQAKTLGDKPYILYEDKKISFAEYDRATCRAVNGLAAQGARPGDGVAILMTNCPEYLYIFYGMPRGGFYSVPVNVALKREGLRYILTNSDVKYLIIDDALFDKFTELGPPVGSIEKVFVRRTSNAPLPAGTLDLSVLFDAPSERPSHNPAPDAITYLMYTSGTTGFPKGVVNRNHSGNVQQFLALANVLVQSDDVLYTALPLFHANALILTAGFSMCAGVPFALEKRFSASRFWDSMRRYGVTQFNALGAMIPILMKQPEKPNDADNPVRVVNSAACPANLWEAFEKRFGVKIWEAYGAVDGGGVLIFNFGNAPVGSVGKPMPHIEWKLADDDGNEVPLGQVGELVTKVLDKKTRSVEYYKNPDATASKVRGDWIHSGDLFYADAEGNLYFVDRKTDSMRRRGENISSFEVENIIEKHPAVAECAAFGVPSELGEDDVMVWVKPKEGAELDLKDLMRHCAANMAYFMVPRYVDVVDEIPRTGTLRVQKGDMKKRGVTAKTWDREKQMPELELKKA